MFNARNIQIGEEGTLLMETKKDGPRGRRKKNHISVTTPRELGVSRREQAPL